MAEHMEEPEPLVVPDEPDEPDEPDADPEPAAAVPAPGMVPSVGSRGDLQYDYRVDAITNAELLDGKSLPRLLAEATEGEWHLVDIIDAGDRKAVLLRKRKDTRPERRPVGFIVRA